VWALLPPGTRPANRALFAFHTVEARMSRVSFLVLSVLVFGCSNAMAQGSPQERSACSRDASRFCRKVLNEGDGAVQQCLQQHRSQLSRACSKVFQSHGM
jgi:hypothetical protein